MTDLSRLKASLKAEAAVSREQADRLDFMADSIEETPTEPPTQPDRPPLPEGQERVTQTLHGFERGDQVAYNGIEGRWEKARSASHTVVSVEDRDTFVVAKIEPADPDVDPEPPTEPGEVVGHLIQETSTTHPERQTVLPSQVRIHPDQRARCVTRDQHGYPRVVHYTYPAGATELRREHPLVQEALPIHPPIGLDMIITKSGNVRHLVHKNNLYADADTRFDWYRFGDEVLGVHLEEQRMANEITIVDVLLSNGAREPGDNTGATVDGEVIWDALAFSPPSGMVIVLPYDKPGMSNGGLSTVVIRTPGYLDVLMSWEIKIAVCPPDKVDEAYQLLQNRQMEMARGEASYVSEYGGFGPQDMPLMDMDDSRFAHGDGKVGFQAEYEKSSREMNRLRSEIANDINDAGIINTRGGNEGNEPGGFEIQWGQASWHLPVSRSVWELQNMQWGSRACGLMFDKNTGYPLSIYDFAENDVQPWSVNRTNGSEDREHTIPWPRRKGTIWNTGTVEEMDRQRRFKFLDHSHSCRWLHGLKYRIWVQGSVMAQLIAQAGFNHYQFDPSLYDALPGSYGNFKTVPGLEASEPMFGHGALGRQIGWVLDLFATAWSCDFNWARFRSSNEEYADRLGAALDRVISPCGGTRRRLSRAYGGSPWSWASPPPPLSDTSDLVCEQTFEATYVFFGAYGMWKATGMEEYWRIAERIGRSLARFGAPLWAKWFAYGRVKKDAANRTVLDEAFDVPMNLPEASTGRPHMVNLCAMMWRETGEDGFYQQACAWIGCDGSYDDAISKSMPQFWGEIHDWRLLEYWNSEGLIALAQLQEA